MDAGHADVVQVLDVVAHHLRGHDRFFGDRNITGPRRDDYDFSLAVFRAVSLEHDGARQFAILRLAHSTAHRGELFFSSARGQHGRLVPRQPREDRRHLPGGLALGQHHLGEAGAQRAVVIHLGEVQVFERQVTEASDGLVGRELASAHVVEELSNSVGIQVALSRQPKSGLQLTFASSMQQPGTNR